MATIADLLRNPSDDNQSGVNSFPPQYEEQVASLLQQGTPQNQIESMIGTKESQTEQLKKQAQEIYERTGEAPSWSESVGFTPGAPAWLNPQNYTSSGYAAPYTQEQITGAVDPNNYRTGSNGQLYASAKGPSDLSGGEYLIDQNTGKFKLDNKGNPFGVTYAKSNNFDDWLTTPAGQLALVSLPALMAGGVAAYGAYGAGAGAGGYGITASQVPNLAAGLGATGGTAGGAGAGWGGLTATSAGGMGLTAASVPSLTAGLELGGAGASAFGAKDAYNAYKTANSLKNMFSGNSATPSSSNGLSNAGTGSNFNYQNQPFLSNPQQKSIYAPTGLDVSGSQANSLDVSRSSNLLANLLRR